MLTFYPTIYEDELLYSNLCRYYVRSGYKYFSMAYRDLFQNTKDRPSKEFINLYNDEAKEVIFGKNSIDDVLNNQKNSIDDILNNHTMLPAYICFLPDDEKDKLINDLKHKPSYFTRFTTNKSTMRYLRYCPLCAIEDRKKHGETYWHRSHQINHLDICPKHKVFLNGSTIPLNPHSKIGFYSAEENVPDFLNEKYISNLGTGKEIPESLDEKICRCTNKKLIEFSRFMLDVFTGKRDIFSANDKIVTGKLECPQDVKKGAFKPQICSVLWRNIPAEYLSNYSAAVSLNDVFSAYCRCYEGVLEPMSKEHLRDILAGKRFDFYEVCQLGFWLGNETN